MTQNNITDVDVTPAKVTFKMNNKPMAIIKVQDGDNHVWRIQFPDQKLSAGTFANPERAILWITSGRPMLRSDEMQDAASQSRKALDPQPYRPKKTSYQHTDNTPDPEWQPMKSASRRDAPVWDGSLSAIPGAPTLLNPKQLLRPEKTPEPIPDTPTPPVHHSPEPSPIADLPHAVAPPQPAEDQAFFSSMLNNTLNTIKAVMTAILQVIQGMGRKLRGVNDLVKPEVQAMIVAEVTSITKSAQPAPTGTTPDIAKMVAEVTEQINARITSAPHPKSPAP